MEILWHIVFPLLMSMREYNAECGMDIFWAKFSIEMIFPLLIFFLAADEISYRIALYYNRKQMNINHQVCKSCLKPHTPQNRKNNQSAYVFFLLTDSTFIQFEGALNFTEIFAIALNFNISVYLTEFVWERTPIKRHALATQYCVHNRYNIMK